jgi:putative nucleotidyltransferase with HDIG domain
MEIGAPMTLIEPTATESAEDSPSLIQSLLRRFFVPAALEVAGDVTESDEADAGTYVIAPGGYRIRVPQPDDVHHSIGEMLPSVRQGLSILPPLPRAVTQLLKEVQDPNATAASVADIAASDPALTASLIRTVNSAAFGSRRKITSVAEAVTSLGFSSVKSLVLRLQLDQVLGGKAKSNDDVEDLWIHSLIVSYIADCLARRVPGVDRGFVSTLGLLHDIGKLVVHTQFPQEAAQLRDAHGDDDEGLLQRESRVLGVDHAELGATLAGGWGLPGDLVKAIRWHHFPARAFEPGDPKPLHQAMSLLQMANQLAKYCYVYGDEMEIDAVTAAAFDAVGFAHDLPALLGSDIRAAASRAIFFADEGRSITSVRRFLRLNQGDAAARLLASLGPVGRRNRQVAVNEELCSALFAADAPVSRFSATANRAGLQQLLAQIKEASLLMPADSRLAASLIAGCLLSNTATCPEERVEAAVGQMAGRTRLAIRSSALTFNSRFGSACPASAAAAALDSELANVLNLAWFESIATSGDGGTLVFTARSA